VGRSLDVTVVYGYDLGGSEAGWKFNKAGKYETAWPSWVKLNEDGYPDDSEDEGFAEQAGDYLLREMAGFTEEYRASSASDYFARKKAAEQAAGIDKLVFDSRGASYDYDQWAFGIKLGSGYDILEINRNWFDPATLNSYDAILNRAVTLMQLEFDPAEQPGPRVLALVSFF
jgi:hypothetical protein